AVIAWHLDRVAQSGRREQTLIARALDRIAETGLLLGIVDERAQVFLGEALPRERRWLRRKRLGGPSLLAGHVGFGDRALLDGPERVACDAIEYPDESLLAGLRHYVHHLAVMTHPEELRRRGVVVIPDIVMNHLEM